jgi:exopolysaccharide biosynthesis WecB/TagA/CpsF family protein
MKVAFLNAHLANVIRGSATLKNCLDNFAVLNDGIGINIASRILYKAIFPENMNGTDLIPRLLAGTKHSLRIFLLGAKHRSVSKAAAVLTEQCGGRHQIVGFQDGYFDEVEGHKIIDRIRTARPDVLLVALGNPKQEFWIEKHVPDVCPRAFAVGALFDFISGEVPRAPRSLRRLNLEWLFRLCNEPLRLARRYFVGIPSFMFYTFFSLLRNRVVEAAASPYKIKTAVNGSGCAVEGAHAENGCGCCADWRD